MPICFTKMHAMGNDVILAEAFSQRVYDPETLAIMLTDRTFGIGGEALVTVAPCDGADARLTVCNADGTDADPSGFAPFCAAKLLFDRGIVRGDSLTLSVGGERRGFRLAVPERRGVSGICGKLPQPMRGEREEAEGLILHGVGELSVLLLDECFPDTASVARVNLAAVATKLGKARGAFLITGETEDGTAEVRMWVPGKGETRMRTDAVCAAAILLGGEKRTVRMTGGEVAVERSGEGLELTAPVTTVFDGVTVI